MLSAPQVNYKIQQSSDNCMLTFEDLSERALADLLFDEVLPIYFHLRERGH